VESESFSLSLSRFEEGTDTYEIRIGCRPSLDYSNLILGHRPKDPETIARRQTVKRLHCRDLLREFKTKAMTPLGYQHSAAISN
jgi:hypothetical protein